MPEEVAVEIWFPVVPDEEGYPSSQPWEQLYAWPVGDGGYRIDNIPFFVKNVAVGDVVLARLTEMGWYEFAAVRSRSGHSTFRIWLSDDLASSGRNVAQQIIALGCEVETTLERLIAIDVPPDVEPIVWDFIDQGRSRGVWGVQVGYSPE